MAPCTVPPPHSLVCWACPACPDRPPLQPADAAWRCASCGTRYPVRGDIVDFVAPFAAEGRAEDHYGAMFGSEAAAYDAKYDVDTEHGWWVLRRLQELVPGFDALLGGRILEIGAGTGHLTAALASGQFGPPACLVVTDLAGEMLAVGNERFRDSAVPVHFGRCNVRSLPTADASLDLVIGFDVLHHVLDYDQALLEIRRVLRPGGACAVKEPHRDAYRLTAWLCGTLLATDRHWNPRRGLTNPDRARLVEWRGHIFASLEAAEANDLERLATWDDKYLFAPEGLAAAAERAGFSRFEECNVMRRQRASLTAPEEFYEAMLMQWLEAIGISRRGRAWAEPFIADLDLCLGDALLAAWPMNTVFLFWR